MASNERVRKYLEAGAVLGEVVRARTGELVRELGGSLDAVTGQLTGLVRRSVDLGRRTADDLVERVLPGRAGGSRDTPPGKAVC
jgi:hypothetical protein